MIVHLFYFDSRRRDRRGAHGQAGDPGRRGQVRRGVHLQRPGPGRAAGDHREHHPGRVLPLLLRGRVVYLPFKGAHDQRVRLRLPILRQPPVQRPASGRLHPQGAVRAHHGLLPAQLHRRAVSLLRRAGQPRLYHRADDRGPAPIFHFCQWGTKRSDFFSHHVQGSLYRNRIHFTE